MFPKYLLAIFAFAIAFVYSPVALAQSNDQFDVLKSVIGPSAGQRSEDTDMGASSRDHDRGAVVDKPAPMVEPEKPQNLDYSANLKSDVFGANLFTGAFARQAAAQYNPNYVISVGDSIRVRLWGAFEFQASLTVDPQGNVFLPNVGPIRLLGVRNKDLQSTVDSAISRVFRSNVFSYASLAEAQPVRVYVGGFVRRPGAYAGTSMDSILNYLDQAGGIDPDRGTFLRIEIKRGTAVRATMNLYDFLLNGEIPQVQLADGDVIFVGPRESTILVSGLVENAKRFEFSGEAKPLADLIAFAKPMAMATHVRVVRNTGVTKNVEYYPLSEAPNVVLKNGDELAFTADKKLGTITVRVEGEHESPQEYVLPYGSHLGDLLGKIEYSNRSDRNNIQLFRESVRERQRKLLEVSLRSLETAALNARSGTSDEALLRKQEADLILRWIDRARKIEPNGQVVISQSADLGDLLLENGDILRVPIKDGLVLVSGEVLFPNAVAFDRNMTVGDYINRAGGYTNNADATRIIVARPDGSFAQAKRNARVLEFSGQKSPINQGDEILVLPKIDVKSRQIFKDMTQIIYQIAVSAGVVLGL
ncbi:polysaccharide biosynthesis/export family protein [Rhizorhapis sp. SPR117]|uniref:polysaccharide biosynthesis/export family protein n=1 Tax=Rhizorhapis sp. SPR117 TaxID=2912611 RepID=UPI001F29F4BA|nr:SLBB domain-containing protein [Rhizorhapis sp. SPR117]